jgi:hypothetical protein
MRHSGQFPSFTLITIFHVKSIGLIKSIALFVTNWQTLHNLSSWVCSDSVMIGSKTRYQKKEYVIVNELSNRGIGNILVEVLRSDNMYKILEQHDTKDHGVYVEHYLHEFCEPTIS